MNAQPQAVEFPFHVLDARGDSFDMPVELFKQLSCAARRESTKTGICFIVEKKGELARVTRGAKGPY